MATKKYLDLQEYTDEDLVSELRETEEQFQKLRFDHSVKGLDNPLIIKEVRRDIARLKAEIRRRELAKMSDDEIANRSKTRKRRRKQKKA